MYVHFQQQIYRREPFLQRRRWLWDERVKSKSRRKKNLEISNPIFDAESWKLDCKS